MLEIINLTPNIGQLTQEEGKYYYNLGKIPQGKSISFILEIQNQLINYTKYGCQGCTKGEIENLEKNSKQTIIYDSPHFGDFHKLVNIHLMNGDMIQLIFKGTSN
jgi:hypothetical protein